MPPAATSEAVQATAIAPAVTPVAPLDQQKKFTETLKSLLKFANDKRPIIEQLIRDMQSNVVTPRQFLERSFAALGRPSNERVIADFEQLYVCLCCCAGSYMR